MKNLIRLTDYNMDEITEIFKIADEMTTEKYRNFLKGKTAVMFFQIPVSERG